MKLTDRELADIMLGKRKSPIYDTTVKQYKSLKLHADGEYPDALIKERRPHESDYLHKYRKEIYQPITKETVGPVITSLGKIRRSTDWNVSYSKANVPPSIKADETLQAYCETNFPYYGSVTNWTFAVLLKTYLIDPNALVLVKPLGNTESQANYEKPYCFVFNSPQILDYKENEYAILVAGEKHVVSLSQQKTKEVAKWYVITDTEIRTYVKAQGRGDITLLETEAHNLGYLPIVKLRAVFIDSVEEYSVYESRIGTMLPRLNEAVREYSDQQANIVNHLFPERWEYATQNCEGCVNEMGISTGQVKVETGKGATKKTVMQKCSKCGGSGKASTNGPFKKLVVTPINSNLGETAAPIPPAGYVSKDPTIIETVDKRIEFHQYKALCSINMQFLMQTPLNQSGIAKEVDRDELNNFVYNVAEDIVAAMDGIYKIICDYRYRIIVPNVQTRKEMLPDIAVPEKYDILSTTYLADEVKGARDSGLSGNIVAQLELEYCTKKFNHIPEVREEMQCIIDLDPMVGATEDEKMTRYQNGGVTKLSYVVSCNIVPFVKKALKADKDFSGKTYEDKMKVVTGYAEAILNEQKAAILPTTEEIETKPAPDAGGG